MNSEWTEPPQPKSGVANGPGAQLKVQREAMGWSIDQVADQLKLAPRQVVALEEGDFASLPNLAVVRGFVRAYAKVVKLDAAPLVAMIDLGAAGGSTATPARREIAATFSETRFPSMTQRSKSNATGWIVAAVLVLAGVGFVAYERGYISPASLMRSAGAGTGAVGAASTPMAASSPVSNAAVNPSASASSQAVPAVVGAALTPGTVSIAPVETRIVKPGEAGTGNGNGNSTTASTLQSTSVPLISVPPPVDGTPSQPVTSGSAALPAAGSGAGAVAMAPATPTVISGSTAAAGANALVLTVSQDSWIEVKPARGPALLSRLVKAGSVETLNITEPVSLVIGKPAGVAATLRGSALALPSASGAVARLSVK